MFGSTANLEYYQTAQPCDGHVMTEMEKILRCKNSCVMTHNSRCEESKDVVQAFLPWLANSYKREGEVDNKGTIEK
jgi:hypothetical protein